MNEEARKQQPLLISYDGSADAQHAIDRAGSLFRGRAAVVVTVWQPLSVAQWSYPLAGVSASPTNLVDIDRELATGAAKRAAEGADRAEAAGLEAESLAAEADGPIWKAILEVADERDAAAIVVGPRGLSALSSVLLGSVSHAVTQHARRPVMIVPRDDERDASVP